MATRFRATRKAIRSSRTQTILKEWLANDPRLEDSKVELTFANMAAVGCQPSVQSPDLLSGGKLAVGSVGGDALGAYSKSK